MVAQAPDRNTEELLRQILESSRSNTDGWLSVGVAFGLAIALVTVKQVGNTLGAFAPGDSAPVKKGDVIQGYPVTSGFGPRTAPDTNQGKGSSFHAGIDLATPIGINLYSPGKTKVECLSDPTGYGTYAVITMLETKGTTFEAGHLARCQSGEYTNGVGFAMTGNTGNSSGPHLHWTQKENGNAVPPIRVYLDWVLTGNRPPGKVGSGEGLGDLGDFANRIAKQESGGDHTLVNEIGAMGKYQFMPFTLAWVSEKAFGRRVSHEEFLKSEAMQDKAAKVYWASAIADVKAATTDPVIQCRKMASYHYSGRIDLWNNNSPQGHAPDGSPYPSIAQYTKDVCTK